MKDSDYDTVLRFLADNLKTFELDRPPSLVKKAGLEIWDKEANLMLNKLSRDGYITFKDGFCHGILPEGIAFINKGGYVESRIKQHETETIQSEKLKIDLANAKRVYDSYWVTFAIAIAAFLISVILLVLKLKE